MSAMAVMVFLGGCREEGGVALAQPAPRANRGGGHSAAVQSVDESATSGRFGRTDEYLCGQSRISHHIRLLQSCNVGLGGDARSIT
jgi:hypothetical protein